MTGTQIGKTLTGHTKWITWLSWEPLHLWAFEFSHFCTLLPVLPLHRYIVFVKLNLGNRTPPSLSIIFINAAVILRTSSQTFTSNSCVYADGNLEEGQIATGLIVIPEKRIISSKGGNTGYMLEHLLASKWALIPGMPCIQYWYDGYGYGWS